MVTMFFNSMIIFLMIISSSNLLFEIIESKSLPPPPPPPSITLENYCFSEKCYEVSKFIKESLNPKIDPCNDFYEFACGGWLSKNPLPKTKPSYSTAIEANDLIFEKIEFLLKKSSAEEKTFQKHKSKTIELTKFIYNKCLDLNDEDGEDNLIELSSIFEKDLFYHPPNGLRKHPQQPSQDHQDLQGPRKRPQQKWYEIYLQTNPIAKSLFEFEVISNPRNNLNNFSNSSSSSSSSLQKSKILSLDSVEFLLNDNVLLQNSDSDESSEILQAYFNYLEYISILLPNDDPQDRQDYHQDPQDNPQDLQDDRSKLIESIISIEKKLSSFKMSKLKRRDPTNVINILSIESFSNLTKFQWLENLIQPMFENFQISKLSFQSNDLILVTDLNYFKNLIQFLEDDISPKILKKYLQLKIIEEFIPFLNEPFRLEFYKFLKIKSGVHTTPERWRTCYNQLQKLFPWAISRLYLDNYFNSTNQLQKAKEIIEKIHQTFIQMLENPLETNWIDNPSRLLALKKLKFIKKNIAYPQWLLNNSRLDQFYNWNDDEDGEEIFLEKNFENYLKLLNKFKWKQLEANLKKLQQEEEDEDGNDDQDNNWPMEPARVNAAYSAEDNSITIPAGILIPPFFHSDYPPSLNFGAIGSVIGHELTHSLDDEGRYFDHLGLYHQQDWWSEQMMKNFNERSKCLIEQYSNIKESSIQIHLDGNRTLGENIADNGGLREAFLAFKREKLLNPKEGGKILWDLPEFTSEQLFFISNAQIWCTAIRPETLQIKIENDLHVPAKYRVNIPMSNSKDFSDAFKCSKGTKMNPSHKCILW